MLAQSASAWRPARRVPAAYPAKIGLGGSWPCGGVAAASAASRPILGWLARYQLKAGIGNQLAAIPAYLFSWPSSASAENVIICGRGPRNHHRRLSKKITIFYCWPGIIAARNHLARGNHLAADWPVAYGVTSARLPVAGGNRGPGGGIPAASYLARPRRLGVIRLNGMEAIGGENRLAARPGIQYSAINDWPGGSG